MADIAKLQREIKAIQQQAESTWATERMENALLRERINEIAAEVAKLAIQLEGPNSPIEALLAEHRKASLALKTRKRHVKDLWEGTIEGDEVGRGDFRGQIKLGMAGQGEIVTGQETILALLLKKIRQSISLG